MSEHEHPHDADLLEADDGAHDEPAAARPRGHRAPRGGAARRSCSSAIRCCKSKALPIDRLRRRAARRDRADGRGSWHDALGIGLAATQVGAPAPPARLPRRARRPACRRSSTRCSSGRRRTRRSSRRAASACPASSSTSSARSTCGSGARTRAATPILRRGLGPRGARDPARDGPPRRRPDPRPHRARPAQRGDADPARGRPRPPPSRPGGATWPLARADRLPRHLGLRRRRPAAARRRRAHRPQLVVTRPDRPAGRGRKLHAAAGRGRWRELGHRRSSSRRTSTRPRRSSGSPPRAARCVIVCAFGALIKEPLLSRPRDPQRPPVAAAALARRGADRAGDHGRRRRDRRVDHAARPRGSTAGRSACSRREPISPGRRLRHARRPAERRSARCCSSARSTSARRSPSSDEDGVTYAEKIGAADRTLDPPAPPATRARIVRALTPHIGARIALPDGSFLGVTRAHADGDGSSSSSRSSRPAGGRWPTTTGPAGIPTRRARAARPAAIRRERQPRPQGRAHRRASAPSRAARTPTARCTAPRRASPRATVRSPSAWPSARCSGAARSTGSATAREGQEARPGGARRAAARARAAALPRRHRRARRGRRVRRAGASRARGHKLVNAVLRRVQREGVELPGDDTPWGAAIRHAHPLWLDRAVVGLARARTARARCWPPTTSPPSSRCASTRWPDGRRPLGHPRHARGRDDRRRRRVRPVRPPGLRARRDHAAVARGAARRRGSSTPSRASGSSTSAPRPAARRRISRR